jgi:Protein of Unknown function (DUF2784)
MLWRMTADLVVAIHVTYIAIVLLGFATILVGAAAQWQWVRNVYFRVAHFAMVLLVCVEAANGSTCPLTSLESALRLRDNEASYPSDFIGYWLDRLIFYDAPAGVFIVVYFTFGTLVLLTFWIVPMRPRKPD